ncbi:MAG: pilin assembly protein [Pseudomonadales bacterium]|nr:pilin assembly protein [Pseudomonadales bacterium]
MMRVRQLAQRWGLNNKTAQTTKSYTLEIQDTDAARIAAIVELFDVCCDEDVISELLTAALDEFEEALPYKSGPKVVALDELNDPIYEDIGLTPKFMKIKEQMLVAMRQAKAN